MRKRIYTAGIVALAAIGLAGCSTPKLATTSASPAANVASGNGMPKLSASEVESKIKTVQASTTIPESAKPKIIESIRAQGTP